MAIWVTILLIKKVVWGWYCFARSGTCSFMIWNRTIRANWINQIIINSLIIRYLQELFWKTSRRRESLLQIRQCCSIFGGSMPICSFFGKFIVSITNIGQFWMCLILQVCFFRRWCLVMEGLLLIGVLGSWSDYVSLSISCLIELLAAYALLLSVLF